MITEDYVSFEVAKLLNKKGFDEECNKVIHQDTKNEYYFGNYSDEIKGRLLLVPTQQMACRWLREVHYIHIAALCPIVDVDTDAFGVKYNVVISNLKNHCLAFNTDIEDNEYDTYEEAVEAAIKYCLENLI